ncbi:MAG: DinB family protein [Chloroflexi bacterium]|nr:DinB family protein [Chloroflexota bacterium]MDQ3401167.1 DinB family protein [Chloroflexota bacterium]
MTDETFLRLVRHNTWANLRLLELCGALPPEQLAWTTPGTFGTLNRTLHHIVAAEHGYLERLTGEPPPIEVEGRGKPLSGGWSMGELVERASSNGERMERLVSGGFDPLRVISDGTSRVVAAIVAAQYVHHGSDHRAHAGTILGAHGVEIPLDANEDGLDLWGYGTTTGESGSA